MSLSLPFLERLQIPGIIEKALCEAGITTKPGYSYTPLDILMTLLLGFLLKSETFDEIHARIGGHDNYGVWIGKKRLPSLNVIKKRLQEFVTPDLVEKLKQLLAHSVARAGVVDLGVLYIDAHFIPYYGKRNISKGYSTIRRLALRGIYHHFVGDRQGRPVMFYLTNGSVRLNRTLPRLLKEIKELRKQHDPDRPPFIVFDREVYDAKLFKWLDGEKVVFLTYMKNAPDYPDDKFSPLPITIRFRTKIKRYQIFSTYNNITGYHKKVKTLAIRDHKTGKKSVIITNCDRVKFREKRIRPRDESLVGYMVNRWGQENFFKRTVNEMNINHNFGYQIQVCSSQPLVDNPKVKELQKSLTKFKKGLEKTQSQITSFLLKQDKSLSLEELAKNKSKLKELLQDRLQIVGEINACQAQLNALPPKMVYTEAFPEKELRGACNLVKKDLLDTLKIMAFFVILLMEEKFWYAHRNKRTLVPTLEKLLLHPTDFVFFEGKCIVHFHNFRFTSTRESAQAFCHNLNLKATCHLAGIPIKFDFK